MAVADLCMTIVCEIMATLENFCEQTSEELLDGFTKEQLQLGSHYEIGISNDKKLKKNIKELVVRGALK